ncbi:MULTISPECIES: MFS transporter [Paenibacillus]|uniref:MFS transporter n=1 Tax=Paenibacillus borealis TaxID=160799 RepID=A0ABX3GZW4_PAEBO|nr:MFS transporter [Paenibacillus borealis]OMD41639.1 MFS transporter [Paenibacillus borealis]
MEPTQAEAPRSAIPHYVPLLFAIACGLAVANIYYAQPLLDAIADEFRIPHSSAGIVITITQACYALGLLLLVPLGDLLNRRSLIAGQMLLSVLALILVGTASSSIVLFIGMATVGLLAVVTQTLVAFAATLAAPAERGRVVGLVTSGIVIGILLARTFAGLLTDLAGWRSVYIVSAGLSLFMAGVLFRVLPHDEHERESLSYLQLLRSTLTLFLQERVLRIRAALALMIFTAFSILWTSLVLPLSAPPLSLSHTAIGAFGLAGAAGALAAARAGRLADRGLGQRTTGAALILLLVSWLPISYTEHSLWALIAGILLLDLAVQAVHVTNQSMILSVRPEARSRLTAGYMIFYSIGSATGSIASTTIYEHMGWNGVCLLGAVVSALALLFWALTRRLY